MLPPMARPPKEAATASALAPALLRFVASAGGDAALLATQCGLEETTADADEVGVTPSALASMLRGAAGLLADPHLSLRLPAGLPLRRYDAVVLAARAAATPRDVLDLVAQYAALVFPHLEARVEVETNEVRFGARFCAHPRGLGYAVDAYVLAFVLAQVRERGVEVTPVRVWMSSARPASLDALFTALGTREVAFGAADTGFALTLSAAARALTGADERLLATAHHLASIALPSSARARAFASVVAARIEAALPGAPTTETVAAALQMSARTLQRRLDDEGSRFSEILDVVRERIARRLVLDRALPLGEVAYRSGFSDVATFGRAFKRWTGLSPGVFRRRQAP
jgi:AraC-like DNA-binding protein